MSSSCLGLQAPQEGKIISVIQATAGKLAIILATLFLKYRTMPGQILVPKLSVQTGKSYQVDIYSTLLGVVLNKGFFFFFHALSLSQANVPLNPVLDIWRSKGIHPEVSSFGLGVSFILWGNQIAQDVQKPWSSLEHLQVIFRTSHFLEDKVKLDWWFIPLGKHQFPKTTCSPKCL